MPHEIGFRGDLCQPICLFDRKESVRGHPFLSYPFLFLHQCVETGIVRLFLCYVYKLQKTSCNYKLHITNTERGVLLAIMYLIPDGLKAIFDKIKKYFVADAGIYLKE
jgi:hypothetical protein